MTYTEAYKNLVDNKDKLEILLNESEDKLEKYFIVKSERRIIDLNLYKIFRQFQNQFLT
jgi:hypothetical protein